MDIIRLFLPIIWAVTSTVIGLVLYKSSAALFEDKAQTRRIKPNSIGGLDLHRNSGIPWPLEATPPALQTGIPDDAMLVRNSDIQAAVESLEQGNAAVVSLIACSKITPPAQCIAEINMARDRIIDSLKRVRLIAQ